MLRPSLTVKNDDSPAAGSRKRDGSTTAATAQKATSHQDRHDHHQQQQQQQLQQQRPSIYSSSSQAATAAAAKQQLQQQRQSSSYRRTQTADTTGVKVPRWLVPKASPKSAAFNFASELLCVSRKLWGCEQMRKRQAGVAVNGRQVLMQALQCKAGQWEAGRMGQAVRVRQCKAGRCCIEAKVNSSNLR